MTQGHFIICDQCDKHKRMEINWSESKYYPIGKPERDWHQYVDKAFVTKYGEMDIQVDLCSKECLKAYINKGEE